MAESIPTESLEERHSEGFVPNYTYAVGIKRRQALTAA